jgi:hypothetical protein
MTLKTCSKCGVPKPEIAFSLKHGKPIASCRECKRTKDAHRHRYADSQTEAERRNSQYRQPFDAMRARP